nr:hypothetical protein [Tanacetum cinerariifolium]
MEGWKPKSLKNKSFAEIQKLFDKAMKRVNTFVDYRTELVVEGSKKDEVIEGSLKRTREELEQENAKKQKIKDDKESASLNSNFNREDLEVLWRLVKDGFVKINPVDYMDSFLLHTLKTMFEHHVQDNVWKNQQGLAKVASWKSFDYCGVHYVTLQSIQIYLLVEKMYPLTHHTLNQMFNNVKLQVDYEYEMAYELLRLVKKQIKEGYRAN